MIALLRPPVDVLHKFSKPVECLALGYLAGAARRAGFEAQMLDAMLQDWTNAETIDEIEKLSPDILCITIVLNHFPQSVVDLCRDLRLRGYSGLIVIGGHAVSFFADRIVRQVPDVDAVVSGEGEEAIVELARRVEAGADWRNVAGVTSLVGGQVKQVLPKRIHSIDSIAPPARDLGADLLEYDGLFALSTSRGCYARCTFCSVPRFYGLEDGRRYANGAWLGREPKLVVKEVEDLYSQFPIRELLFVDDEFFGGNQSGFERASLIANALASRALPVRFALSCRAENVSPTVFEELRAAGLAHVYIGLESGSDDDLKLLGKAISRAQNRDAVRTIKSLGLSFQAGFMLFNHKSTLGSLRENFEFLQEIGECKPTTLNSGVDPHFGAPLVELMRRDGVLSDDGLSMSSTHPDARVRAMQDVAGFLSAEFKPFLDAIASLSSSITFEWRRTVPHRRREVSEAIKRFEVVVNDAFAQSFSDALDRIEAASDCSIAGVLAETKLDLKSLTKEMNLKLGLLQYLMREAGEAPRYWTQRDLMLADGIMIATAS